jgi:acyl-CoA synthetase (AMP-forming)/AMP-acid ligase II
VPKIIHSTDPLLPDIFALHGKWRADKIAVISDTETLSWKSFNERTYQVANGLRAMGLENGDRVIVLMSNGLPMMEALFGIMAGGFVSAPLNVSVTNDAILNMILDSGAKAIFVSEEYADRIKSLKADLPKETFKNSIFIGSNIQGGIDYEPWRNRQNKTRPENNLKPDDYLNIIYSSGTTGEPKGIVHTHKGRRDWAYDMALTLRYNSSARFLVTIGLYSNITWVGLLSTMLSGGTVLINGKFEAADLWRRIEQDKITHLSMVPTLYERMMDVDHKGYDASSVQGMMSAGSPLRAPVKAALFDRFECGIIELYGLTEGVITTLDPEDAMGRLSSVGLPLLGTDLKILDEEDRECETGQAGEIVSCGRIVMPEYFNKSEATKEALWVDSQGVHWLRTGDIGYLDENSYLYIVDRKKDMILSGGQNVYPQDIEAVMASHEDVKDVAVIGVKSRKWGETPLAVIAAKKEDIDKDALQNWTNAQMGKQQRIVDVDIIEEIPRNPNGKILKRELRKKYEGRLFD